MESLGNMPKVKELVTGGPGFETRTSGSDIPNFFFFLYLPDNIPNFNHYTILPLTRTTSKHHC